MSSTNYKIKEIYYTLQGEGHHTGRPAVFCRFSGCNLWSGREEDRHKAICQFCDTDFWGTDGENGGKYSADSLARKVKDLWPKAHKSENIFVVCTGGEPLLQLDQPLIESFHLHGIEVAVETNGTLAIPKGLDWVCMSPKAGSEIVVESGDELKVVIPQHGLDPLDYEHLDFNHLYIQPMDSPQLKENIDLAIQFCKTHPKWKLSLQTHKLIGIP